MNRHRTFALVAVAAILLLAVFGLRGSFLTASVSSIAHDFFNIELDNRRLALLVEEANRESVRERQRADSLQSAAASRIKELEDTVQSLKAQHESDVNAVAQGRKAIASLADLQRQAASLRSEVSALQRRVHELDPPVDPPNAPGREHWWSELVERGASVADISVRLGSPAFVLEWVVRPGSKVDNLRTVGRWSDQTWERDIFPRFGSTQSDWPDELREIFEGISGDQVAKLGTDGRPQQREIRGMTIHLWPLGRDRYAVAVTATVAALVEMSAFGTWTTEWQLTQGVVGCTVIPRSAFPPRANR